MGCTAQGSKVRGRPASNGNQRARGVHSVRGAGEHLNRQAMSLYAVPPA
eukprot:COSAG06_NODE_448_length_15628_cov_10.387275_4_plen_49_part_00